MKRYTTLLCILIGLLPALSGQNQLFLPFDNDYQMVSDELQQIPYLESITPLGMDEILVSHDNAMVSYKFNGPRLYKITMTKHYSNKKEASRALDGTLKYFDIIDAPVIDFLSRGSKRTYVAIRDGIVYELVVANHSGKNIDVILSSRKARATPSKELVRYDYLAMADLSTASN
jgi:hypothetical protein